MSEELEILKDIQCQMHALLELLREIAEMARETGLVVEEKR
jgi:hypothetical protein